MSILTPSGLESYDYGTQGWNNIAKSNLQKLNAWGIHKDSGDAHLILPCPDSVADDGEFSNSELEIYHDDTANKLKFKLREASGGILYFEAAPLADSNSYPQNYLGCLKLEYISASQVKINPGCCRSDDNTTNMTLTSAKTVNITASGANGLDAGSEAASTWYYVWVIYDPTGDTYAGLLSASASSPTLPGSYTKKRRVGCVRNNSSGDFLEFRQFLINNSREYRYIDVSQTNLLANGSAIVWSPVSASSYVPPTSRLTDLWIDIDNRNGIVYFRENGTTPSWQNRHSGSYPYTHSMRQTLDASQVFEYYVSDANLELDIFVQSFVEELSP